MQLRDMTPSISTMPARSRQDSKESLSDLGDLLPRGGTDTPTWNARNSFESLTTDGSAPNRFATISQPVDKPKLAKETLVPAIATDRRDHRKSSSSLVQVNDPFAKNMGPPVADSDPLSSLISPNVPFNHGHPVSQGIAFSLESSRSTSSSALHHPVASVDNAKLLPSSRPERFQTSSHRSSPTQSNINHILQPVDKRPPKPTPPASGPFVTDATFTPTTDNKRTPPPPTASHLSSHPPTNPTHTSGEVDSMHPRSHPHLSIQHRPAHLIPLSSFGGHVGYLPAAQRLPSSSSTDKTPFSRFKWTTVHDLCRDSPLLRALTAYTFPHQTPNKKELLSLLDRLLQCYSTWDDSSSSSSTHTTTTLRDDRLCLLRFLKILCLFDGTLASAQAIELVMIEVLQVDVSSVMTLHDHDEEKKQKEATATATAATTLMQWMMNGKKREAYNEAMSSHAWMHALIISSHLDKASFHHAVASFAMNALPDTHPLKPLYLLYAHKEELAGQCMAENVLTTAWRSQLATLIANRTAGDTVPIAMLGDALWKKGHVYLAHVCYLLAGLHPDAPEARGRLVLIGGDHWQHPQTLSQDCFAFQCTEIYEAVRQLSTPAFQLPHLTAFRWTYCQLLIDSGRLEMAQPYLDRCGRSWQSSNTAMATAMAPRLSLLTQSLPSVLSTVNKTVSGQSNSGWLPRWHGKSLTEAFDQGLDRFLGTDASPHPSGQTIEKISGSVSGSVPIHPSTHPSIPSSHPPTISSSIPSVLSPAEALASRLKKAKGRTSFQGSVSHTAPTTTTTSVVARDASSAPVDPWMASTASTEMHPTMDESSLSVPLEDITSLSSSMTTSIVLDDLGFGNQSLSVSVPKSNDATTSVTMDGPERRLPKANSSVDNDGLSSSTVAASTHPDANRASTATVAATSDRSTSGSFLTKITGLFGGARRKESGSAGATASSSSKEDAMAGTGKAVVANLGEESTFYFDKTANRWVNKAAKDDSASSSLPPPPPPFVSQRSSSEGMRPPEEAKTTTVRQTTAVLDGVTAKRVSSQRSIQSRYVDPFGINK